MKIASATLIRNENDTWFLTVAYDAERGPDTCDNVEDLPTALERLIVCYKLAEGEANSYPEAGKFPQLRPNGTTQEPVPQLQDPDRQRPKRRRREPRNG